ncbi:MAG: hypothetical protein HYV07_15035 [Deltaproteobacteria bacterium]|nr:hypothetical protein [Deltaproteobacteria bacterium]
MRPALLLTLVLTACAPATARDELFRWPAALGVPRQTIPKAAFGANADRIGAGARLLVRAPGVSLPVPFTEGSTDSEVEILGTYSSDGRGDSIRFLTLTEESLAASGRDLHSAEFVEVQIRDVDSKAIPILDSAQSVLIRLLVSAEPPCDAGSISRPTSVLHEVQPWNREVDAGPEEGDPGEPRLGEPLPEDGELHIGPVSLVITVEDAMYCAIAQTAE